MVYTVKNVKNIPGRRGIGYNANLYKDNKKIASIYDEGFGGQPIIDWVEFKFKKEMEDSIKPKSIYIFIEDLINDFEINKQFVKTLKKDWIFVKDPKSPISLIKKQKEVTESQIIDYLKNKYPNFELIKTFEQYKKRYC